MRRRLYGCALSICCALGVAVPALAGSSIKSDEEVVFFTTAAHREGKAWVAPVHGWIFEPERDSIWRGALVASLRETLQVQESQEAVFRERVGWFLVDNERGKKLRVRAGSTVRRLGKSRSDGHFRGVLRIPGRASHTAVAVQTRARDKRRFRGTILLVPEEGLSVISDIDDTIKITGVRDHELALRRTFLQSFQAVPGMSSLYRKWQRKGAVFHYVSASPWHLCVPLREFMQRQGFPRGTMDLREFRVKDKSGWKILDSSKPHKRRAIETLLRRFPRRRFVLVGDSGEADPEIYAELARKHPRQVEAIYIRLIRPDDMPAERLQEVARDLQAPFQLFDKASELSI